MSATSALRTTLALAMVFALGVSLASPGALAAEKEGKATFAVG